MNCPAEHCFALDAMIGFYAAQPRSARVAFRFAKGDKFTQLSLVGGLFCLFVQPGEIIGSAGQDGHG
jgi:hypothetical protein